MNSKSGFLWLIFFCGCSPFNKEFEITNKSDILDEIREIEHYKGDVKFITRSGGKYRISYGYIDTTFPMLYLDCFVNAGDSIFKKRFNDTCYFFNNKRVLKIVAESSNTKLDYRRKEYLYKIIQNYYKRN